MGSAVNNAGMWVVPDELPRQLGGERGERLLDQLGNAPNVVFDLVRRYRIACKVKDAGTLHSAAGSKGHSKVSERARQRRVG